MENEQYEQRKEKLNELRALGINPYANGYKPEHLAGELLAKYGDMTPEELEKLEDVFTLAGRVVALRDFGKSLFLHVADRTGRIQGYMKADVVGPDELKLFKKYVDLGDFIGVKGQLFKTKTGELTVNVSNFTFLTKTLHPLPEKWHGLKDVEMRYRQRYLDLISNADVKNIFLTRSRIISLMRRFLDERDFVEVETPILHPVAGGAAARPFRTHHNALDMDLYLRIAPELYLKRLVVGGIERVYEIGRTFRNEGVSTQHNPEFTMIEFYQAYATFEDLMDLTEELICSLAMDLKGSLVFKYGEDTVDMSRPWKRINITAALEEKLGKDTVSDDAKLFQKAASMGLDPKGIRGKAIVEIFEALYEQSLVNPTFVYGFPLDVSPLARKNEADPEITDRFELYITGREIANAFSELNDPIDQRERFEGQLDLKSKGEEEVHEMDEDYVTALEHGMPPTAGEGIGIDRLVMLFTDSPSIREVIFFPHLKPE
ncbi:MAG: lysine--tRNA ligase [Candidatus Dadabacteria bacterium]|nr:lysine--tRNA ligase [Candidatus Dadabacteria bacterium]